MSCSLSQRHPQPKRATKARSAPSACAANTTRTLSPRRALPSAQHPLLLRRTGRAAYHPLGSGPGSPHKPGGRGNARHGQQQEGRVPQHQTHLLCGAPAVAGPPGGVTPPTGRGDSRPTRGASALSLQAAPRQREIRALSLRAATERKATSRWRVSENGTRPGRREIVGRPLWAPHTVPADRPPHPTHMCFPGKLLGLRQHRTL